ncbi:hypothetical protein CAPTEDRAFT_217241 [Capitella teleta]|uniref:Apple domain-containing protein n=1 Tax=Capitella teleta TaxID=283909 RepID=R7TIG7_CAPTE|nr:hypothetical protein CAPTEDRAFT_217241 [Capitella teleta]|eukprot:ELT90870.1 hypothetical protein CAPTEDRAFT_217241 [Capitella teleta]
MGGKKNGVAIPGKNCKAISGITLDECKELCLRESCCKSIDYDDHNSIQRNECKLNNVNSHDDVNWVQCDICTFYNKECLEVPTTDMITVTATSQKSTTLQLELETSQKSTTSQLESETSQKSTTPQLESETSLKSTTPQLESETSQKSTTPQLESETSQKSTTSQLESETSHKSTTSQLESETSQKSTTSHIFDDSTLTTIAAQTFESSTRQTETSRSVPGYSVQREKCIADVDGSWAEWTPWSTCSASCDEGTTFRRRKCAGKSGNGRPCIGQATQNGFCVREKCLQEEVSLSRSRSILKRREKLLPTQAFTESDSSPYNISVATVAILVLVLFFGGILVLDYVTLKRHLVEYCWASFRQRSQRISDVK